MTMIKAIETEYDGVMYRSRLEALWAAQLDALGIEHVYEPQGYDMHGVKYLPDFYLPQLDMFAEVKGMPDNKSALKIERLIDETGKDVVLLLSNGKMQFFSAKFGGYSINDNFGLGACEYNRREFNSRIEHDKGRYTPKDSKQKEIKQEPSRKVDINDAPPYDDEAFPATECGDDAFVSLLNPAAFNRVFSAILKEMKKTKQALYVLFMNTKARFDADSKRIYITFPAESVFAFNACQKPDVQKALKDAIKTTIGEDVPFVLEKQD